MMFHLSLRLAVRVKMLNINYGRNKELLDACEPLKEYAWLVQRIRKYGQKMEIEEAVDQTINELPENFEIRTFLVGHLCFGALFLLW